MTFPELEAVQTSKQTVGIFGGLNETMITAAAEFSDMENISSDMYPGLTTRPERGTALKTLTKPHGIYWKNGLFYVDGTEAHYIPSGGEDKTIGAVLDSDKQLVGMGAYICIFPDKKVYNTSSSDFKSIEASWTQSSTITVAPVSDGSTYVKVSCTGIGKNFSAYDAVTISGFTKYTDQINTSKIIQEISNDYLVIILTDGSGSAITSFTQASGVVIKRECPDLDFVCEFNNRLWGCSSANHEIYASKLGDPLNWNAFEGISTDSYALSIGSDGDFTGVLSHQGYVVFFKEDYIHTIYGTKPSNFTLDTVQARGPAKGCEKSLCHVNESVMYAARNDICIYEGSTPESVSDKLSIRYQAAAGNQFGSKYYVSLQDKLGAWHLYVYDLRRSSQNETSLWYKEDDLEMLFTAFGEGKLYFVDASGSLRTMQESVDSENLIPWSLTSGYMEEGSIDRKKVHKLQFNFDLAAKGDVTLEVRYDNSPQWIRMASITADGRDTYTLPVKLRRAERYQYRLSGHGQFRLYGMSRVVEQGSSR